MTSEKNAQHPYFPGDSYDTPGGRRHLLDRLFLNSRWYFFAGIFREILRSRSLALNGRYDARAWAASSYRVFSHIEACGGRFRLSGLTNIASARPPVVFISNHMSTLETFVFPCIIAPIMEVTFVVKESLVKHPFFGPIMRSRNPIVVFRENAREDFQIVMQKGKELLAAGISVVVFPQSTRTADFRPEDFNSMGIKLASAAGVDVIPVAIKTDFWGNGKLVKDVGRIDRRKTISMSFGEPFSTDANKRASHQRTVDFVMEHLARWAAPESS